MSSYNTFSAFVDYVVASLAMQELQKLKTWPKKYWDQTRDEETYPAWDKETYDRVLKWVRDCSAYEYIPTKFPHYDSGEYNALRAMRECQDEMPSVDYYCFMVQLYLKDCQGFEASDFIRMKEKRPDDYSYNFPPNLKEGQPVTVYRGTSASPDRMEEVSGGPSWALNKVIPSVMLLKHSTSFLYEAQIHPNDIIAYNPRECEIIQYQSVYNIKLIGIGPDDDLRQKNLQRLMELRNDLQDTLIEVQKQLAEKEKKETKPELFMTVQKSTDSQKHIEENKILALLQTGSWGEDATLIRELRAWTHYPLLLEAYETLREDELFDSKVHGKGHIHRTLLFAALIAWKEELEEKDVRQLLRAASYHDVGRTSDIYDIYHGTRSALRMEELTGVTGEELIELQAAVAAHSWPDRDMKVVIRSYTPEDFPRTMELTRLLKDADNLDRVRLGDLNADFLRHESAKALEPFAWRLLEREKACIY